MELTDALSSKFSVPVTAGAKVDIPSGALDDERNQYLSRAFLNELRDMAEDGGPKLLGLTEVDIYDIGMNYVFGQADIGGQASIISLARLFADNTDGGGTDLLRERALKEAVHELGHNFGLEHCRDRFCVMHFSSGIQETDIKSAEFCPRHSLKIP